ncbi:MAG: hypothetical protein Fur0044_05080 [Anaerolineae bacterium]|nr:ATP-binding protein [Anaerolineales bacterium]MCQ3974554.1 ATP-binding protein [Anaerolineae bacterium]
MMTTRYILHTTAELKNLSQIRDFIEAAALGLGLPPESIHNIQLAVDEVATNIMVHGYQGQGGPLEIEVKRPERDLVVSLRDEAFPFDPTTVPPPDLTLPLAQRPIGGLGIHLVRQTMDEIHHQVTPTGGNQLTLIKHDPS